MDVWIITVDDEVRAVCSSQDKLDDARAELSDSDYNRAVERRWTVDGYEVDE